MINDKALVDATIAQLVIDEGFKSKPYKDTVGVWTIGHGLTYLTPDESAQVVCNRLHSAYLPACIRLFAGYEELTQARQSVILNMCFNLGEPRLKKFVQMRRHIRAGDYNRAADEMLDSTWARQVGHRAIRLAREMRLG
jgi:lysozyme